MGIAVGMGTEKYAHRQLPDMKSEVRWCGYARIVIFTDRRGRKERR